MNERHCLAANVPAHLECQICFDSWREPLQLVGCGHIFCAQCLASPASQAANLIASGPFSGHGRSRIASENNGDYRSGNRCAICYAPIVGTQQPSEDIVAAALGIPVLCSRCGWRGTRQESLDHVCDHSKVHPSAPRAPQHVDTEWVRVAMATYKSTNDSGSEADGTQVTTTVMSATTFSATRTAEA